MPRRSLSQRSVLMVVASMLIASGGVRIGIGAGPAIAFAEEQVAGDAQQSEAEQADMPVSSLVSALQEREARLQEREVALEDRMRALSLAENELRERLTELQEAEASLMATLALSESANDTDIGRLTTVYESMKAAEAAALFEEMAPEFASGFLVRMQPESAAAIMAGLEPQTAYSISVIIAGRNANAPTE
ncbi:MAG: hypothetical protein AAF709_11150 [Pseudomonadota bacterium]